MPNNEEPELAEDPSVLDRECHEHIVRVKELVDRTKLETVSEDNRKNPEEQCKETFEELKLETFSEKRCLKSSEKELGDVRKLTQDQSKDEPINETCGKFEDHVVDREQTSEHLNSACKKTITEESDGEATKKQEFENAHQREDSRRQVKGENRKETTERLKEKNDDNRKGSQETSNNADKCLEDDKRPDKDLLGDTKAVREPGQSQEQDDRNLDTRQANILSYRRPELFERSSLNEFSNLASVNEQNRVEDTRSKELIEDTKKVVENRSPSENKALVRERNLDEDAQLVDDLVDYRRSSRDQEEDLDPETALARLKHLNRRGSISLPCGLDAIMSMGEPPEYEPQVRHC